ncbi:NAD(P)H-dependent glycerol-3-phosphate dehydrogenase [uncultured Tateyamaria sp.]|uniref:NAD(P)H-dependent glycerol-3-phosphate dehydrogenase n=1 Tax=Tateyamaria sp. 1078 TaxID=3417464 RepID=UPI00260C9E21|nr:NAD(P)H-dependent glycerol-3-phosphate dehydrogenase [uncultured Tateyamaria sp.]
MSIAVLGAGAFGTALAIALGKAGTVTLWARDSDHCAEMSRDRQNTRRLPDCPFPPDLRVSAHLETVLDTQTLLLALPMQALAGFVQRHDLHDKTVVACCKGMDLTTGYGPSRILGGASRVAVLTGPSFASDIARGLPTALTLACADAATGVALQEQLSTGTLRLYRSTDVTGAELGGALKNVIAIGAGAVMGAGLGTSARAAFMTRGFAEMQRVAVSRGAEAETLMGLSGFGDLVLTCTSDQSRNYRLGHALGAGQPFDGAITVEGAATAQALVELAAAHALDIPVCAAVADLVAGRIDVQAAMARLLARPLKEE